MYDLAIIGAGAAGIACAKEAINARLNTVLLERNRNSFGGTCLNYGCIPTKFFLHSAQTQKSWQETITESKNIIEKIKRPLFGYLTNKGIAIQWGDVEFIDTHTIRINNEKIEAKNIIIACGSAPVKIISHKNAVFAEQLFNNPELPDKFLIVGAGYIGIEFASLLKAFGKDITILEKENTILPGFDSHLANRLRIILETKGIKIHTGKTVDELNLDEYDQIVIAAGRKPNIIGLGLESLGILSGTGWIKTNSQMRTPVENIYACGDITGKKLLAYIAEYQADLCIKNICGSRHEEDYSGIPSCVFSLPQMAKVGILEDEAKQQNLNYRLLKTNFLKFSSPHVYNDSDGFLQVLVDNKGKIIGAGIISNIAAELISVFALAIKNSMDMRSIAKCILIHPTLSEIIPAVLRES